MTNISNTARIEVHVELIEQLFNSIDPSPFHARDLDSQAQDYIVEAARGAGCCPESAFMAR